MKEDLIRTAYKSGYEKGKAEEHRWWSAHCAKCTDADRPQGKWLIEKTLYDNYNYRCSYCDWYECHAYPDVEPYNFCPNCGAKMKGTDDES